MWKCLKNVFIDISAFCMTGNDPDEVETGGMGATSYLSRIGVKPGIPVEGSVTPMFEGKSDIDLNSIALSNEQVKYVDM